MFSCNVLFNTQNKIVTFYTDYYYEKHLADYLKYSNTKEQSPLYLSKDNFIHTLEIENQSDEIITMLRVEGNAEMDIMNAICTGEDYIENYKYFMENEEMSKELIQALTKYYEMLDVREPI